MNMSASHLAHEQSLRLGDDYGGVRHRPRYRRRAQAAQQPARCLDMRAVRKKGLERVGHGRRCRNLRKLVVYVERRRGSGGLIRGGKKVQGSGGLIQHRPHVVLNVHLRSAR